MGDNWKSTADAHNAYALPVAGVIASGSNLLIHGYPSTTVPDAAIKLQSCL